MNAYVHVHVKTYVKYVCMYIHTLRIHAYVCMYAVFITIRDGLFTPLQIIPLMFND